MSTLLAIEQEACQSEKSLYKQCVMDFAQGIHALHWGAINGPLHQIGELAFRWAVRYQVVMSTTPIEELAKKLADAVPDGVRTMRADLEDSFRSVLQTGLDKLELVTREEFEVQEAVLQRTREKLEALEKRLEELE